jgi:diguanylate cyclase
MTKTYAPGLALLAAAFAVVVAQVVLYLATRVRNSRGGAGRLWVGGAAIGMGIGVWCTHFVSMLAWRAPFPLSYDPWVQLVALLAAGGAAAVSLHLVTWPPRGWRPWLPASLMMGLGIASMEYLGLTAITVVPGLEFGVGGTALAVLTSVGGSLIALGLNGQLKERPQYQALTRFAAAFALGGTVIATHYLAMASVTVAPGATTVGGVALDSFWLAVTIGAVSFAMLCMTGVFMVVDDHMASRSRRHSAQLAEVNAKLKHVALHDGLTGLPNRIALNERLDTLLSRSTPRSQRFAVMVMDLDRFKAVNDSLGHQSGDRLLCAMAERMRAALRPTDFLARIGGDEFVVLCEKVRDMFEIDQLAVAIQGAIARPLVIEGAELQMTCSTGIALFPDAGRDAATLLRHADAAMYHGKNAGRQQHSFYEPRMDGFARERLEIESGLRRAVSAGEFELHYQPRVDVVSGRIVGAEALMRWRHPDRGMVMPSEFIPVAEESTMIVPMTQWALQTAARQVRHWLDAGVGPLYVSVNLSASLLGHANLERMVVDAAKAAQIDPSLIELELTESAVMRDPERSAQILHSLVRCGFRISVDDFGTGYSSLSYLRRLPLHGLKVDRSFIRELVTNREDAEISRGIISLAHSLKLRVTAEGVENDRQLALLRAMGCDEYQGYFCSPAVPAAQIMTLFREGLSASQKVLALRPRGPLLRA